MLGGTRVLDFSGPARYFPTQLMRVLNSYARTDTGVKNLLETAPRNGVPGGSLLCYTQLFTWAPETTRYLIDLGASVDEPQQFLEADDSIRVGKTPLMCAIEASQPECVKMICEAGARDAAFHHVYKRALDIAVKAKREGDERLPLALEIVNYIETVCMGPLIRGWPPEEHGPDPAVK